MCPLPGVPTASRPGYCAPCSSGSAGPEIRSMWVRPVATVSIRLIDWGFSARLIARKKGTRRPAHLPALFRGLEGQCFNRAGLAPGGTGGCPSTPGSSGITSSSSIVAKGKGAGTSPFETTRRRRHGQFGDRKGTCSISFPVRVELKNRNLCPALVVKFATLQKPIAGPPRFALKPRN